MRSAMSVKQLNPVYDQSVIINNISIITDQHWPGTPAGGDHDHDVVAGHLKSRSRFRRNMSR